MVVLSWVCTVGLRVRMYSVVLNQWLRMVSQSEVVGVGSDELF